MDNKKINDIIMKLYECEKELYEIDTNKITWDNHCTLDECIRKVSRAKELLNNMK